MTHDKSRLLNFINDVCHRKCLTRASNSTKGLMAVAGFNRFHQLGDCLFLVPLGGKFTDEAEIHGLKL